MPSAPVITSTSPLPTGVAQRPYSFTFSATAGTPPYLWEIFNDQSTGLLGTESGSKLITEAGDLLASQNYVADPQLNGLTINAVTGTLSGLPNAGGSATFVIQLQDSLGATTQQLFTLAVAAANGGLDDEPDHSWLIDREDPNEKRRKQEARLRAERTKLGIISEPVAVEPPAEPIPPTAAPDRANIERFARDSRSEAAAVVREPLPPLDTAHIAAEVAGPFEVERIERKTRFKRELDSAYTAGAAKLIAHRETERQAAIAEAIRLDIEAELEDEHALLMLL